MQAAAADPGIAGGEIVFQSALTPDEAAALRARGVTRAFPRGAAIFHQHGMADRVLVVQTGCVKLSAVSEEGKEVVLAIRGPGDLLGEMSVIDGRPRSATATALDPVDALGVAAPDFIHFLEDNPRVARVVMQMLGARLREADAMRVELSAHDSMSRVAARIVELSIRFGDEVDAGVQIELPLSQEELAGWTGCSRDSVVKALQAMRGLGWIETGRRRITVLALEELRRRAG